MDQIIPTNDGVEYRVETDHSGFTATIAVRERFENDPYGGRQVHSIDIPGLALHPNEVQYGIESFCAALNTPGYDAKSALEYAAAQIGVLRGQAAQQAAASAQATQQQADAIAAQAAQAQLAQAPVAAPVGTPAPLPSPSPTPAAPVAPVTYPAPVSPVVAPVASVPVTDGETVTLPGIPSA